MDVLRPLLTALTQIIVRTVAKNVNYSISNAYSDRSLAIIDIATLVMLDLPTLVS